LIASKRWQQWTHRTFRYEQIAVFCPQIVLSLANTNRSLKKYQCTNLPNTGNTYTQQARNTDDTTLGNELAIRRGGPPSSSCNMERISPGLQLQINSQSIQIVRLQT